MLSDYDFSFPQELIAQQTAGKGQTKILICPKNGGELRILQAQQIISLFEKNDCLVVNNTKVIPARLFGKTRNGGKVEILLIKKEEAAANGNSRWECWVKPGKSFKGGKEVSICNSKVKCFEESAIDGKSRLLQFSVPDSEFENFLSLAGNVPLPPYINRRSVKSDEQDYQTVFAKHSGAVAAPTASLHFSEDMVCALKDKGVSFAEVTLHVGPGTFANISETEDFTKHKMHSEDYIISEIAAQTINECRKKGGRIICVGTTSVRVLETVANADGFVKAQKGSTDIFLYPGKKFKAVDGLLTNFHWPKSSLILLVSAFYGRENTLNAYRYAVENKMKLFSYGDGMLILPPISGN